MFPILNVGGKMSNLKSEIDVMTPEQVNHELIVSNTELNREKIKRILLWLTLVGGVAYLVFGM